MRATLTIIAIGGALILGFIYFVPPTNDLSVTPEEGVVPATTTPSVTVKDSYKKGTHTITGSILAPNACTVVTATSNVVPSVASSTPAVITLRISMPEDTGICLQVPQEKSFSVTAVAGADAVIQATVNGQMASTTKN